MNINPFKLLKAIALGAAVAALAFSTTSCEPNAGTGALIGAGIGAGVGAIAGDDGGDVLKGAAIGAGAGAIAGAVIKAKRYKGSGGNPDNFPTARRTQDPGYVYSPYGGHVVDVRGFHRGEIVVDPKSGNPFIVP